MTRVRKHRKKHLGLETLENRVVLSAEANMGTDADLDIAHPPGCVVRAVPVQPVSLPQTTLFWASTSWEMATTTRDDFIEFPKQWTGGLYEFSSPTEDHDNTPLTVILDFNDPGQANTTDGIGNTVSTFSVTGYGFAESDRELVYNSVLAKVQEHYHDINSIWPVSEQLDIGI